MLETPEGLHHYQKVLELLKTKEMRKVNTEWFETAGILLKEMAEALDYVARGPRPDDSDLVVAKQALNKFKEWK